MILDTNRIFDDVEAESGWNEVIPRLWKLFPRRLTDGHSHEAEALNRTLHLFYANLIMKNSFVSWQFYYDHFIYYFNRFILRIGDLRFFSRLRFRFWVLSMDSALCWRISLAYRKFNHTQRNHRRSKYWSSFSNCLEGNFAYVQGLFGGTNDEVLESPEIVPDPNRVLQLEFSYWKTSYSPILEVRKYLGNWLLGVFGGTNGKARVSRLHIWHGSPSMDSTYDQHSGHRRAFSRRHELKNQKL